MSLSHTVPHQSVLPWVKWFRVDDSQDLHWYSWIVTMKELLALYCFQEMMGSDEVRQLLTTKQRATVKMSAQIQTLSAVLDGLQQNQCQDVATRIGQSLSATM